MLNFFAFGALSREGMGLLSVDHRSVRILVEGNCYNQKLVQNQFEFSVCARQTLQTYFYLFSFYFGSKFIILLRILKATKLQRQQAESPQVVN